MVLSGQDFSHLCRSFEVHTKLTGTVPPHKIVSPLWLPLSGTVLPVSCDRCPDDSWIGMWRRTKPILPQQATQSPVGFVIAASLAPVLAGLAGDGLPLSVDISTLCGMILSIWLGGQPDYQILKARLPQWDVRAFDFYTPRNFISQHQPDARLRFAESLKGMFFGMSASDS